MQGWKGNQFHSEQLPLAVFTVPLLLQDSIINHPALFHQLPHGGLRLLLRYATSQLHIDTAILLFPIICCFRIIVTILAPAENCIPETTVPSSSQGPALPPSALAARDSSFSLPSHLLWTYGLNYTP